MDIIPFVGFDQIKFGQTREEVQAILGEPSEQWEEEVVDGYHTVEYAYLDSGIELSFAQDDDYRLGTISFMSQEFSFQGQVLVGLSEVELIAAMGKTNVTDFEIDDIFEEEDAKDYLADSVGLSCWLEEGDVLSVSIFPKYTADGETVIWPE